MELGAILLEDPKTIGGVVLPATEVEDAPNENTDDEDGGLKMGVVLGAAQLELNKLEAAALLVVTAVLSEKEDPNDGTDEAN